MNAKNIFLIGLIVAASGIVSTPVALLAGIAYGLSFQHPYFLDTKKLSTFLLQASVVALGFRMNLRDVLHVGRAGFLCTAVSITLTMLVGLILGRCFSVGHNPSLLISAGTAICGGSAIAAVGPVVEATEAEMAASLGTVFLLNAIALLIFPMVGWKLQLTQAQFGLWSALAIHDTSSVIGSTAKYGSLALMIGITVKLARALWIVPMTVLLATLKKDKRTVKLPWFILLFGLAVVINTWVPAPGAVYSQMGTLGRIGLTVTLYLIGSGISKSTLQQVGVRPLLLGVMLWIVVALSSLVLIKYSLISI